MRLNEWNLGCLIIVILDIAFWTLIIGGFIALFWG